MYQKHVERVEKGRSEKKYADIVEPGKRLTETAVEAGTSADTT